MNAPCLMQRQTTRDVGREAGFTLIELLVSMVVGLLLILVAASLYLSTARTSRFNALQAQMNEDGALAIQLLSEQISLAGYSPMVGAARAVDLVPVRGCEGGFTAATDSGLFENLACSAGAAAAPDAIAIRYVASAQNSPMVGNAAGVLQPANCAMQGITPTVLAPGNARPIADNRFYVAADPVNSNTPTLYCRGSNGPGTFSGTVALIPNIEDLQIRYAVTRAPLAGRPPRHQVTAHVDASHAALGATTDNWHRVAAVHVCVLARTAQPIPGGDVSTADVGRYVDCSNAVRQANDGRLRRALHATVYLLNTRPAVPAPYRALGGVVIDPYDFVN